VFNQRKRASSPEPVWPSAIGHDRNHTIHLGAVGLAAEIDAHEVGAAELVQAIVDTCACQKLDPTILMMKSAEDRLSSELAEPLDRPTAWRVLV